MSHAIMQMAHKSRWPGSELTTIHMGPHFTDREAEAMRKPQSSAETQTEPLSTSVMTAGAPASSAPPGTRGHQENASGSESPKLRISSFSPAITNHSMLPSGYFPWVPGPYNPNMIVSCSCLACSWLPHVQDRHPGPGTWELKFLPWVSLQMSLECAGRDFPSV